jgi:hypothetical protein
MFLTALGRSRTSLLWPLLAGAPMEFPKIDRDTLRLISAFKEIKSRSTRRAILLLLEQLAHKDGGASKADQKSHEQPAAILLLLP